MGYVRKGLPDEGTGRKTGTCHLRQRLPRNTKKEIAMETNDFHLQKIKVAKNGGLDVHYQLSKQIDGEILVEDYHQRSAKIMHPDLQLALNQLRPILAMIYCLDPEIDYERIDVTSITLVGHDDTLGVVIGGCLWNKEQKAVLLTPKIRFASNWFGTEKVIENIIGDIAKEVHAYLFDDKKAKTEAFHL